MSKQRQNPTITKFDLLRRRKQNNRRRRTWVIFLQLFFKPMHDDVSENERGEEFYKNNKYFLNDKAHERTNKNIFRLE